MAANNIGWVWLYGLVVLFILGIIELLILPALEAKFVPSMIAASNQTLSPADVTGFTTQTAQVIKFMDIAVYALMFVIIVYMIIMIFKKEETVYQ
jgi:hypothetical protein